MGWKRTLRSIEAASRRAERESRRRHRELEKQHQQLEKMQELERTAYEVEVYENHIDLLLSVHKECGTIWNWEELRSAAPPVKPTKSDNNREAARAKFDGFKPGFFDKVLGRIEKKRAELAQTVEKAQEADKQEHHEALKVYETEFADWQATCELAEKVLAGNAEGYIEAIRQADPFSDISELGSSIQFQTDGGSCIEATLRANSEEVIPAEIKSLLKSGKLSIKKMPKGKFYELYQDYVCGSVLRVAREIFALLPIETVIVTALADLLNPQTGHIEEQPILSVALPRATLERLNFEMLDPSDSMSNFIHRMNFQKTKGFNAVEKISVSELQLS